MPPREAIGSPVAVIIAFALIIAVSCGIAKCVSDVHAGEYGGNSAYKVAAHVDESHRYFVKTWHYSVRLTTEEPLANGTREYSSHSRADYQITKDHVGEDVLVTIGKDGYIEDVEPIHLPRTIPTTGVRF